jgi:hypothetical protein
MSLLFYAEKYLSFIRPVIVIWRHRASQAGAFATSWYSTASQPRKLPWAYSRIQHIKFRVQLAACSIIYAFRQ